MQPCLQLRSSVLANARKRVTRFTPKRICQCVRDPQETQSIPEGSSQVVLPALCVALPVCRALFVGMNLKCGRQGLRRTQYSREPHSGVRGDRVKSRKHLFQTGPRQISRLVADLLTSRTTSHEQFFCTIEVEHSNQTCQCGSERLQLSAAVSKDYFRLARSLFQRFSALLSDRTLLKFLCSHRQRISLPAKPEDGNRGRRSYDYRNPREQRSRHANQQSPSIPVNNAGFAHRPALIEAKPPIHSLIPLWTGGHSATPMQREEIAHG